MRMRRCNYRGCRELVDYQSRYCDKHQVVIDREHKERVTAPVVKESLRYQHVYKEAQKKYSREHRDVDSIAFYQSKRWKRLSHQVVVEDAYVSGASGVVLDDGNFIVDHIVKRSLLPESKWYDRDNLWVLSRAEHAIKTNVELKMIRDGNNDKVLRMNEYDWRRIINNLRKK